MSDPSPSRDNDLRNISKQDVEVSNEGVRDWSREDMVEFPARTHIRDWVREEFINRLRNFGLNYTHATEGESTDYDSLAESLAISAIETDDPKQFSNWDSQVYKGPKTSWGRVVSSAIVRDPTDETNEMKGFILQGNGNFHDTYGFDRGDGTNGGGGEAFTLLGYDITGRRHEIEEPEYQYRPSPGLVSIESEDIEPGKNMRRTTINFTCWSSKQLDYLDQYFFHPGISMLVEWGWNNFPKDSLFDLSEEGYKKIVACWNNNKDVPPKKGAPPTRTPTAQHIRNGRGNYGFAIGMVTKFNYSIRSDGGYDCSCTISCMSEIGNQVQAKLNKKEQDAGKGDTIYHNIETFVKTTLKSTLVGLNDTDTNLEEPELKIEQTPDQQNLGNSGYGPAYEKLAKEAIKFGRGRFFTFSAFNSSKPYYAGNSTAKHTYITVGYMIDIFNLFLSRSSTETDSRISLYSCWNSRAVAHPNIKSTDGDVLLIPNSLAPRWNKNTFHGDDSTIGSTKRPESMSTGYAILLNGSKADAKQHYKNVTNDFIKMVNAMTGGEANLTEGATIEDAFKKSPRDDLHKILTERTVNGYNLQHPAIAGKLHKDLKKVVYGNEMADVHTIAYEDRSECVKSFPDMTHDPYSGRISDLYVNVNVIAEEVEKNKTAAQMILSIMRRVSDAAAGIWDFQLIGGDTNTPSNTILQLVDTNFSGKTPVQSMKKTAFQFPSHRGDSIIRDLSLSVDPKADLTSAVVFGNLDKKSGFYAKQHDDLILKHAENPVDSEAIENMMNAKRTRERMPDSEKFIVPASSKNVGSGFTPNQFPSFKQDNKLERFDIAYIDKNGKRHEIQCSSATERSEAISNVKQDGEVQDENIFVSSQIAPTTYGSGLGPGPLVQPKRFSMLANKKYIRFLTEAENESTDDTIDTAVWNPETNKKTFVTTTTPQVSSTNGSFVNPKQSLEAVSTNISIPNDFPKYCNGKVVEYKENWILDEDIIPIGTGKKNDMTNVPTSGKMYKIARTNVYPANLPDSNKEYMYQVIFEELPGQETALTDHAVEHFVAAEMRGEEPDPKIKEIMEKNKISKEDARKYQNIFKNTKTKTELNRSVTAVIDVDESYGTDKGDYTVDIEMCDPDKGRMLKFCKLDADNTGNHMVHNQRLDGIDISLQLDGIEGLRLYDVFKCQGIPYKYYNKGVFAISGIKHAISDGDWTTDIDAFFYPST